MRVVKKRDCLVRVMKKPERLFGASGEKKIDCLVRVVTKIDCLVQVVTDTERLFGANGNLQRLFGRGNW